MSLHVQANVYNSIVYIIHNTVCRVEMYKNAKLNSDSTLGSNCSINDKKKTQLSLSLRYSVVRMLRYERPPPERCYDVR